MTWGVVLGKLRRFIRDAGDKPRWSDDDLADFWAWGQDDLVQYVARPKSFTVVSGLQSVPLPDDLYRIDVIKHGSGYTLLPLDPHGEESADAAISDYDTADYKWEGCYWFLTHSTLEFTQALTDANATVFYRAYFPAPSAGDPDMPILTPRWSAQAMLYYCAALSVEQMSFSDAMLRRWASRAQDAGNPTHNPFIPEAKFLMERYRETVWSHIGDDKERGTWHSSYR